MMQNILFNLSGNIGILEHALSGIWSDQFVDIGQNNCLVIYEPNRISLSQIYTFLYYKRSFKKAYRANFCFVPTEKFIEGNFTAPALTNHVIFQFWLGDSEDRISQIIRKVESMNNIHKTVFLDSFANTDLRFLNNFGRIDLYYKKSLFNELNEFTRTNYGDTNLSNFYGNLYDINQPPVNWQVPCQEFHKLRLSPNFLTDPSLMSWLLRESADRFNAKERGIDVHARLGGTSAAGWYGEMRRDAERRIGALKGVSTVVGTGIKQRRFRKELKRSKICFSPFGYGEICWRDIEAIAAGAVLLKPDMSHLRTEPNLYQADETYVPIRWDFLDLEDRIDELLADEDRRAYIAANALRVARSYLLEAGPAVAYCDVFDQ